MAETTKIRGIHRSYPKRGEIYLTALDPTVGHEIQKTRPALVIQNDVANRYGATTIVAAITSKFDIPSYPTEVPIPLESGLRVASVVLLNQIRTVDRTRLIKRLGKADATTMKAVGQAIEISFGLVDLESG